MYSGIFSVVKKKTALFFENKNTLNLPEAKFARNLKRNFNLFVFSGKETTNYCEVQTAYRFFCLDENVIEQFQSNTICSRALYYKFSLFCSLSRSTKADLTFSSLLLHRIFQKLNVGCRLPSGRFLMN